MKITRFIVFIMTIIITGGCATKDPFLYLGVPDKESRLILGDTHNRTQVTPVHTASFSRFETFQRAGMVSNVEMHDNYIYFTTARKIPIADTYGKSTEPGSGGMLTILERYRALMDERKLPR